MPLFLVVQDWKFQRTALVEAECGYDATSIAEENENSIIWNTGSNCLDYCEAFAVPENQIKNVTILPINTKKEKVNHA